MSLDWLGKPKPITSIFVATSPEFDIAVLTVCFAAHYNSPTCPIRLNGVNSAITVWSMSGISPTTIGTAYPTCY